MQCTRPRADEPGTRRGPGGPRGRAPGAGEQDSVGIDYYCVN